MLSTRLWMGSILIVLTAGMLLADPRLAPVFPFLLFFQLALTLAACVELILLLGPARRPLVVVSLVGVAALAMMNWWAHFAPFGDAASSPWGPIAGCFAALVLLAFLWEMVFFIEPGRTMERLGITFFVLFYLGLLPCFFAQLRWLFPSDLQRGSLALAVAIFVPKACDIGAYFTGRLLGRHPLTPILSPKKTVEGAIGGLVFAVLVTMGVNRIGTTPLLDTGWEIAAGIVIGICGMLGDLVESLIKRDCGHKDASQLVPGFGGVLDVVDSVIFTAPVVYGLLVIFGRTV